MGSQCPRWRYFLSFYLLLLDLQTVGILETDVQHVHGPNSSKWPKIVIFWPDMVVSYSVQLMPQYDIVELLGFVIHFQTRLRVSFANTGASTRLELLGTEETSWLPSANITPMTPMSLSSWYFYIVS